MLVLLLVLSYRWAMRERKVKTFYPKKHHSKVSTKKYVPDATNDPFDILLDVLRLEEGFNSTPYYCNLKYPTIGYGHLCSSVRYAPLSTCQREKISLKEAEDLLISDVRAKINGMQNNPSIMAAYNQCDDRRKVILISMAFQMGVAGLGAFKNTLNLIKNHDWSKASEAMLDSMWAVQTTNRAKRHASVIRTGKCSYYGWY